MLAGFLDLLVSLLFECTAQMLSSHAESHIRHICELIGIDDSVALVPVALPRHMHLGEQAEVMPQ